MTPYAWAVERRRELVPLLQAGGRPSDAEFDAAVVTAALSRGTAREGAITFTPTHAVVEVNVAIAGGAPTILAFRYPAPERIVWLPVPGWVVENIWQGDITGRHLFESEAAAAVEAFRRSLEPEANSVGFVARAQ